MFWTRRTKAPAGRRSGARSSRWSSSDLDAVIDYVSRLGSAVAAARVGFFLEQHRDALMVEDSHLDALAKLGPNEPRYLDPKRRPGKLVTRWNLVVPEEVLSRSWEEVL